MNPLCAKSQAASEPARAAWRRGSSGGLGEQANVEKLPGAIAPHHPAEKPPTPLETGELSRSHREDVRASVEDAGHFFVRHLRRVHRRVEVDQCTADGK